MRSGIKNLSPIDLQELEAYLGMSLVSLQEALSSTSSSSSSSTVTDTMTADNTTGQAQSSRIIPKAILQVWDLLESMWYHQALKERHFDAWTTQLKNKYVQASK